MRRFPPPRWRGWRGTAVRRASLRLSVRPQYFGLDGTIECQIKLTVRATPARAAFALLRHCLPPPTITSDAPLPAVSSPAFQGLLSTSLPAADEAARGYPTHGTLVEAGVNAQHHQHFFCARLDFAVDDPDGGRGLVVAEVEAAADADVRCERWTGPCVAAAAGVARHLASAERATGSAVSARRRVRQGTVSRPGRRTS